MATGIAAAHTALSAAAGDPPEAVYAAIAAPKIERP